jgi:methanethiol S-methyltransferase
MAHNSVKNRAQLMFGGFYKYYRIMFNVVSVLLFVFIIRYQFLIEPALVFNDTVILKVAGAVVFFLGLIVLLMAFKAFNLKEFFGIEQLEGEVKDADAEPKLVKSGMYAYVRHPLYFGIIVMLAGALMVLPYYSTLIFVLVTYLYLPVGVSLEEQKLISEFGDAYKQYRKEVKMLIPYIF